MDLNDTHVVPEENSAHSNMDSDEPKGEGSFAIDQEIHELIQNNNLVEMYDILPTVFVLSASHSNDMTRFKKRFSEIHIGKGMCL